MNNFWEGSTYNTESIRYAGSKLKMLVPIYNLTPDEVNIVGDLFSGSTRVSQMYKQNNIGVVCNDPAEYSFVLGNCYITNNKQRPKLREKIRHLNNLEGTFGWFSEYYGGRENNGLSVQEDGKKRLLQMKNSKKLDSIRPEIEKLFENKLEKHILLTSLLLALDEVTNDMGHQVSYLKQWANKSYKDMKLEMPNLITNKKVKTSVTRKKAKDVNESFDLAYIDPPYGGSNEKAQTTRVRYNSYYHFYRTVCLNDQPEVFGAANRRLDSSDKEGVSKYESTDKEEVIEAFDELFNSIDSKYVLLSYNNRGKLTPYEILDLLDKKFNLKKSLSYDHKQNSMTHMKKNGDWTHQNSNNHYKENLFLAKCK
jgi:adenine-specific DNA-methyltransferase